METKFKQLPNNQLHDGIQYIARFENNYGASIVKHSFSYGGKNGLYELAVISFKDDGKFDLCYSTPITSDVLGYLNECEIDALLKEIEEL